MTLVLVNSTAIRAVGYDGNNLYVQFHSNPIIYIHPNVPFSIYAGLVQATSKGIYYNQHIRGRFR